MRRVLLAIVVAAAAVYAFTLVRSTVPGSNIDERQKYWAGQIARSLAPGAPTDDLRAFAKAHGQDLRCYQNYRKEDQCSFDDGQSRGGTSNLPVRLAVIFSMRDNKVVSHQFTTAAAVK
jgi:hypothetical protein